jgi:RecA-family ATPase
VAGTFSLAVAKPKVGKSTFARNLALAVSKGIPFLGRETKQGSVIYLALEERVEDITADFRAMGASETQGEVDHAVQNSLRDPLLPPRHAIESTCWS